MTSNLKDLIESTFYLAYNTGIQPSEVDKLTTHEMREFISLTKKRRESEIEGNSGVLSALAKILGLKKSKGR